MFSIPSLFLKIVLKQNFSEKLMQDRGREVSKKKQNVSINYQHELRQSSSSGCFYPEVPVSKGRTWLSLLSYILH